MDPRKHKISVRRFAADTSQLVLTDGKPPAEFRLFRAGVNESDYGPLLFDEVAAQLVMNAHTEKGNPLYFDFNHGMADPYANAERAKSAGTFDIEVRGGELWAVRCMWTEEAAERISKREYNLFSPYFRQFCDEQGVCRPYELINCAILNLAGLDNLQPIAAGARLTDGGDDAMTDDLIKELRAQIARQDTELVTLRQEAATLRAPAADVVALAAVIGLGKDAVGSDVRGAVTGLVALRGELFKIVGQETAEGAIAALRALKTNADGAVELRQKIEADEAKALRAELDGVFDLASKAGKLQPADRTALETSLLALSGGKVTKSVIAAAKTNVAMLGVKVVTEPVIPPTGGVLPTTADAKMDRLMKIDTQKFQAWQAEQATRPRVAT